jgi:hypothetical protein
LKKPSGKLGTLQDEKVINSASLAWSSVNETYIFPYDVGMAPPWCPYWLDKNVLASLKQNSSLILRKETYSLSLNSSYLRHILLNWNESYWFSPMRIETETASLPEAFECTDRRGADQFAWQGNKLILSENLRSAVQRNSSRGMNSRRIYTRLVLLGTSETRALFAKLCGLHGYSVNVNKTTKQEHCGEIEFYNMCAFSYCGCNFKQVLDKILFGNESAIISASCGLHKEHLMNHDKWRDLFQDLANWAANFSLHSGHVFQFRTSNAINPSKTKPSHLILARNNVRSKFWAQLALQAFSERNVAIFDTYRFTETVFWKTSDHVHFHADGGEVYLSLAKLFDNVIPFNRHMSGMHPSVIP